MKQILLVLVLFFSISIPLWSQAGAPALGNPHDATARVITENLTTKYQLTADQAKQMYTVQVRKLRNFEDIESLKTSDPAKYQAKVLSIQNGALGSIKRILNNKEQVALFQKTQAETRQKKAKLRKELLAKGLAKAEIEAEINKIYAE